MEFDYFLSTENNNSLYYGRINTIFIESEYLESSEINYGVEVKPIKNCSIEGTYPILNIIPTGRPICSLEIYNKGDLKKIKHFVVVDIPNPHLTADPLRDYSDDSSNAFDEILNSTVELSAFKEISKIEAKVINGGGTSGYTFVIDKFDFSVLRDDQIIFRATNYGNTFNEEIASFKNELRSNDKLLLENISCYLDSIEKEQSIEKVFNYRIIKII